MPQKKQRQCSNPKSVSRNASTSTSPLKTTSSTGRILKKTLKAREEEKKVNDIETAPSYPQRPTGTHQSLEKIRKLSKNNNDNDDFNRMKDWAQSLSPAVYPPYLQCLIL